MLFHTQTWRKNVSSCFFLMSVVASFWTLLVQAWEEELVIINECICKKGLTNSFLTTLHCHSSDTAEFGQQKPRITGSKDVSSPPTRDSLPSLGCPPMQKARKCLGSSRWTMYLLIAATHWPHTVSCILRCAATLRSVLHLYRDAKQDEKGAPCAE